MSKKFWRFNDAVENAGAELIIEGEISSESWWGDEATPKQLREELAKHSGDLTVSINSGGGDVFAGVAMYNALKQHDGAITVRVDGLAASIASVIAMAGDKIIMSPGSMMMIHKPWTIAIGDSNEMEKVMEVLNGIEKSIVPIYTARTGLSEDEVISMLNEETWLTAEESVAKGFADEAIAATEKTSFSDAFKSFNSQLAVSMSAQKKSLEDLAHKLEAESAEVEVKEVNEDGTVEAVVDGEEQTLIPDEDTLEAINEVDKQEVTEPVKEDEPVNNKSKETTKMSKQDEIAAENIVAKADIKATTPSMDVKNYLATDEAMEAFARILQDNPGEMNGESSGKVRNAFKEHLETKLGVTNPEVFLPTPLITAIQNAFDDGGEIWNRVAKAGVDAWNAAWDSEEDVNSNDGRARGYNRADEENKAEEVLTFDTRILRPQFVYKYITLNKEDIKEQRSTGALVTYILAELPQRIVREVERAIVLGDGRASNDDYKIKEGNPRGFFPILVDAAAGNYFADTYTPSPTEDNYAAVVKAADLLRSKQLGRPVLIAKVGYVTDMKLTTNANGGYVFPIGTDFAAVLGVDAIIEPDWFNDTNAPNVDAILAILPGYKVVGDTTIEGFQNFILKTNKQEYLQEIWSGGGLTTRKAAVAIGVAGS